MKQYSLLGLLCSAVLLLNVAASRAQNAVDRTVLVEATVSSSPARIVLHWPKDTLTTSMSVYRRLPGASSWGSLRRPTLVKDSFFVDTTVVAGTEYEYKLLKATKVAGSAMTQYGYLRSGIGVRIGDDPGRCLLVVDTTYASVLAPELTRLESDLRNEGMPVSRISVSRTTDVNELKNVITQIYDSDPNHVSTLFLFGHVPVPYSGFMNPDGHPNHFGAWPADQFYGDDDLTDWTDDNYEDSVQNGDRVRDAQYNVAGDGKFDQTSPPSLIMLKIGRVDLSNMSAFSKSEKDLLKQYLDKDHAYRTGALPTVERALFDDNWGYAGGEAFSAGAWRSFAAMVGARNIVQGDYFTSMDSSKYLWSWGGGGGWDQGASGVGSTTDFASKPANAVFTMLFGSYFGDWNVANNFLRAPLCNDYSLTCAWSGRPYWLFFPMGLGHTTGDAALLTENNLGAYDANLLGSGVTFWTVHEALIGDPTLRMRPFVAPATVSLSEDHVANSVTLMWTASSSLLGYNVYRASVKANHYTLLTPSPITVGTFTDTLPIADSAFYLVRGVRDETTPSGNYLNLAYGATALSKGGFIDAGVDRILARDGLSVIYPLAGSVATIVLDASSPFRGRIDILDVQGRTVASLANGEFASGTSHFDWDFARVSGGVYFARVMGSKEPLVAKIVVR